MFPEFQRKWPKVIKKLFQFFMPAFACGAIILTATVWGQSPTSQVSVKTSAKLAFDVASVKLNKSLDPGRSNVPLGAGDAYASTGGLFSTTNWPLIIYISFAYKLQFYQVQDLMHQLPSWVTTDRFDIQARAKGNPTKDQIRLMMQSLLEDRFKLTMHNETRQVPVFALALLKPGKTGPQLNPHTDDPPCPTAPTSPAAPAAGPLSAADPTAKLPTACGGLVQMQASSPGRLRFGGRNLVMGQIANVLTGIGILGRPVLDQTGLTETFDFAIEWTPQLNGSLTDPNFQADPAGPTFLEALQEQLGLKLISQKGAADVMVIDHIEEPSAN